LWKKTVGNDEVGISVVDVNEAGCFVPDKIQKIIV